MVVVMAAFGVGCALPPLKKYWWNVCWYGLLLKEIPMMLNYNKSKIIDKNIWFHSKTVFLVFILTYFYLKINNLILYLVRRL
jgi:hypothetical protein